jgi:hypothetical protein
MSSEKWLPIPDYPNYFISPDGRVKNFKTNRIMSIHDNGKGYKSYCLTKDGRSRKLYIHRLMFFNLKPYTLPEGKVEVDHIDQDRSNNALANLRLASRKDQFGNTGLSSHNTTGNKGVCWDNTNKKWKAYITKNNKHIDLGRYTDKLQAINKAIQARKEYFEDYYSNM